MSLILCGPQPQSNFFVGLVWIKRTRDEYGRCKIRILPCMNCLGSACQSAAWNREARSCWYHAFQEWQWCQIVEINNKKVVLVQGVSVCFLSPERFSSAEVLSCFPYVGKMALRRQVANRNPLMQPWNAAVWGKEFCRCLVLHASTRTSILYACRWREKCCHRMPFFQSSRWINSVPVLGQEWEGVSLHCHKTIASWCACAAI